MDEQIRWFAGIDWGSKSHQMRVQDATGNDAGERAFDHTPAGLAALVA